jgi:hypothetical protein
MKRLIYPATRAIENAVSQPGIHPIRLFPVLWPLWQVETSADMYDKQDFEIIDHFIVRSIDEGGIRDRDVLIRFLHLSEGLVDRCLTFLALIGHLTVTGPTLQLTDLGQESVRDGIRYVAATNRLTLLLERQTGTPLPRRYYGDVPILDTPEIEDGQLADRTQFLSVFTYQPFNPNILPWLENHPNRVEYNLPSKLRRLRSEGIREGFLPCYLIQTADGEVLAYTNAAEQRDTFLEAVYAKTSIEHLIEVKSVANPRETWRKWLANSGLAGGELRQKRDVWQLVLEPSAFGPPPKLPLARIGSYVVRDNHFLQYWCADTATRERALAERSLGIATLPAVTTLKDLETRIHDLAASLHVPKVGIAGLRAYANTIGDERRAGQLNRLAGESA